MINQITIKDQVINNTSPVYFIADIAANHNGSLVKAKDLIYLAADSGASAAKFQHFQAHSIVSDYGFKNLGKKMSHQQSWKKSVYEVYNDASVSMDWTQELCKTCEEVGIPFFTTPYSLGVIDELDPYVPCYKIGSGDITWLELIQKVAQKNKPYMLATGASSFDEVNSAVSTALAINEQLILMQCNTNYTGDKSNFNYLNLNVLKTYKNCYPDLILGLSDHTPGCSSVLGAVALGARVIEKHFTDNVNQEGPDHAFSMDPKSWKEMVDRTSELQSALGLGIKKIEKNEIESSIVQRRSLIANNDMNPGHVIRREDFDVLRPSPKGSISPADLKQVLGSTLTCKVNKGQSLKHSHLK